MMNTFRYVYEIVAQLIQQIMLESPEQSTDQPTNKFLVLYLTYNITCLNISHIIELLIMTSRVTCKGARRHHV